MYDINPLKVSEEIPAVDLTDGSGNTIEFKEYIGKRPVVLVFFRGGWCPYCTRHLSALQEKKEEIEALGFEMVAITPDSYDKLDTSVTRGGNLDYTLLSDANADAIQAFGIAWKINDKLYKKYTEEYKMDVEFWSGEKHHLLPVPAVFVVKDGVIQYEYINPKYSNRLSPEVLMAFLESLI